MEFESSFAVQAPAEEVWDAILDVERVAPCVPGAKVLQRTGDDAYEVAIKVKLGPITQQYRGEIEIVERDEQGRHATMRARARETRGQGSAEATTRMSLEADGDTTQGVIRTDLALTGKAAAMGAGMVGDVAGRITDQFAKNLAAMLAGPAPAPAAAPAAPPPPEAAETALPVLPVLGDVALQRARTPQGLTAGALVLLVVGYLLGRRASR